MAVPKQKISRGRKRRRAAHRAISPTHMGRCPSCGAPKRPHQVCISCGHYNKRTVLRSEG